MEYEQFHQKKSVDLILDSVIEPGLLNIKLKSLGFKLYYDCYAFERKDTVKSWQSKSIISLEMFNKGHEVVAQESCDFLRFNYLLATIDSCFIPIFADKVMEVQKSFGGSLLYEGKNIEKEGIIVQFSHSVTELLTEFGEEPGSKDLAILIEQSYV